MEINYIETPSTNLDNIPIQNGQVIVTSDTHRNYLDFSSERKNIAFKSEVDANTDAIEAIVNEYGAKNLLPNNATSQTINGVTFTVNADGSVMANGTATAVIQFIQRTDIATLIPGKSYIMSGCPEGGGNTTYALRAMKANVSQESWYGTDSGAGLTFIPTDDAPAVYVNIIIRQGYTANNLTFYPMIRDARIADPTYVPYSMTNRELTDVVSPVKFIATPSSIVTITTYNRFRKIGKLILVAFNMQITGATANATLYSNMPLPDEQFEILLGNESTEFRAKLTVSGELIIDGAAPPNGFYAGEMIYTTI